MLVAYKLWAALSSPLGRLVLIGLAFLAWTAYHRWDARSECEAAELARQLDEANRLLRIAQEIADTATLRADVREAELERIRREADAIQDDLPPAGSCELPDDLRQRLLRIR